MKPIFIPASFLAVALATKKDLLKTDDCTYILREEVKNSSSKLYHLFFGGQSVVKEPIAVELTANDPYYFCDYE